MEDELGCWVFFFSSSRRHTRFTSDWSSDVCSSDLIMAQGTYDKLIIWNNFVNFGPIDRISMSAGVSSCSASKSAKKQNSAKMMLRHFDGRLTRFWLRTDDIFIHEGIVLLNTNPPRTPENWFGVVHLQPKWVYRRPFCMIERGSNLSVVYVRSPPARKVFYTVVLRVSPDIRTLIKKMKNKIHLGVSVDRKSVV